MKLFSTGGKHDTVVYTRLRSKAAALGMTKVFPKLKVTPGILITEADCWKIAALTVFTVATSWWLLSGGTTSPSADADKGSQETAVVATAAPAAEEIEIVNVDQTEALAMGIDAVISSECKSEWVSDTTMIMVANVILNRTNDSRYPDTVDQVLTQPYQFSCFSESGLKWVGRAANDPAFRERCMSAAQAAVNGERMLNYGVVYVSSGKQGTVEAQLDGLYFGS